MKAIAIIGGVGEASEFSEALISELLAAGYAVAAIGRSPKAQLAAAFADNGDVIFYWGDMRDKDFIATTLANIEERQNPVEVYIHNATQLKLGPFLEFNEDDFEQCWQVTVKTAVLMSQALLPIMLKQRHGCMIFSGATASLRGNAGSSPFAVAKFGLRALAQSLAREFSPHNIHIAHLVIDGVIYGQRSSQAFKMPRENCIDATALVNEVMHIIQQDASCWTHEVDMRPFKEKF